MDILILIPTIGFVALVWGHIALQRVKRARP